MQLTLGGLSLAVLGGYVLFWGARALFPGSSASTVVLVLVTLAGVALVRPGWNIRPIQPVGYWAVPWSLLLGSAVFAAYILKTFKIQTPYDPAELNILPLLPSIAAVTGVEELLFRQVLFEGLHACQLSGRGAVLATSVAFGGAHLGPLLTGEGVDGLFYLLQSLYIVWIGLLLGELRRISDSWAMSWAGHVSYNVAVLLSLVE